MIHHSSSPRSIPPSKRRSLKNSVSKDSQLSNGSITESQLTIKEEEPETPSSHGSLRKPDHHPLNLPVMLLKRRPLLINSSLLSSVPTSKMLSTLRLTSKCPNLRRKSLSSTTLMPLAPPNSELLNHPLSTSDNSRRKLSYTLEPLTKKPFLLSSSHSWSQPFSPSPRMRSRLFSDNNKIALFFSERRKITNLLSKKFSKRLPSHSRERFFSPMLDLPTKSKVNSLNSWELLRKTTQQSELFSQPT